jgi:anti-sigma regulatory factor (Ser/Thr protein kinase)
MTATEVSPNRGFRHEAFLYSGDDEFVDGISGFVRNGVARGDALLVVVDAPKIDRLRREFDGEASSVAFADMNDVGRNPALIIQAWRDFVAEHADTGRALRGVGEPVSPARSEAALVECHIHESLLNIAFESEPDFWMLCPYDTTELAGSDVAHAVANHPFLRDEGGRAAHDGSDADTVDLLMSRLPAAPSDAETILFGPGTIHELRAGVLSRAHAAGVDDLSTEGLVLAVSEVATNTVVHGQGRGSAALWFAEGEFICELNGPGRITDPMVGRVRPARGQMHGYGMWLANQFCDLVQIRSFGDGTTVRLHLALDGSSKLR